VIVLEEIHHESEHDLGTDPGLRKDGVEAHLQQLLAADPEVLGPGMRLVRREFPTDVGPVDLLCRDGDGAAVAVEVKRRGEIDGVEQLARYVERLDLDANLRPVKGVFAAQVVRPQARRLAEARGFRWVEIDDDELRGRRIDDLRLF
jgi:RecB family endonuclease NucS